MEKSTTKRDKQPKTKADYQSAYIEFILMNGHAPASVFAFAKSLKSTESEFYAHFNSFRVLEKAIWEGWFLQTISTVEQDPGYAEYTVREKLLGFYFTWLETLKSHRSFVLKQFEVVDMKEMYPYFLEGVRKHFKGYIEELILEGKDTQEVADRPFSSQYEKPFWLHFIFITRFWVKDDSQGFEKTDVAVEKSVHLAFDLVGRGPLDSMFDFGKFLFQST